MLEAHKYFTQVSSSNVFLTDDLLTIYHIYLWDGYGNGLLGDSKPKGKDIF